jgi:hypothetical protein
MAILRQKLIIPASVNWWRIIIKNPVPPAGYVVPSAVGEPVPGSEVFLEQEPVDDPVYAGGSHISDTDITDGAMAISYEFSIKRLEE